VCDYAWAIIMLNREMKCV